MNNPVLTKTMHSLEAALRYSPHSLELKASLAEVYIRLGRFDERTMELCEAVLSEQVDNAILQQAQSIGMLIEQSREVEEQLAQREPAPSKEGLEASLAILDEFLEQTRDCVQAWVAWTRFQLMLGRLDKACRGIDELLRMAVQDVEYRVQHSLDYAIRELTLDENQASALVGLYRRLGAPGRAMRILERTFDDGNTSVGAALAELYLQVYDVEKCESVPEENRSRLLVLLLDHGPRETIDSWLRRASLLGWEVNSYSKVYTRALIDHGELDEAFATLQHVSMDPEVCEMLNMLSEAYELRDEVEKAVSVVRFINDSQLQESDQHKRRESELVREAELSMADLQMKSGRWREALQKYISAFCLGSEIDMDLLDQIDDMINAGTNPGAASLLRLGTYFREQDDLPKAVAYLNQALEQDPSSPEINGEMERLFLAILKNNPDLPRIRLELGKLFIRTAKPREAAEQLRLAASSPTQSQEAGRLLTRALQVLGDYTEALEKFRSLQLTETDCGQLYELANVFVEKDKNREALAALDLILRVNPMYRDVGERIRQLEDRVGRPQAEPDGDPKMRELIGDLAVGRYRYLDRLGSGGMGVVHKVFDIRNNQIVAMKILRDSLSGSNKALDRFFREARIAATIKHRNIVNIHDYNISNLSGQSYIVMEFVDGPSMREVIDARFMAEPTTDLEHVCEILYYSVQICDAMEAAHAKGIVHRDIKPDNIMLNHQGEVKITDFGIVHIEEATFTPTGAMLGTPRYMSPEQVTGGQVDARSDIYSLGIVLYESLIGSPPFMTGDISYQQVHNIPVQPREINPIIPQNCAEVIMKTLAKKPEDRYPNAYVLKCELIEILHGLGGCRKFASHNSTEVAEPLIGQESELDLD